MVPSALLGAAVAAVLAGRVADWTVEGHVARRGAVLDRRFGRRARGHARVAGRVPGDWWHRCGMASVILPAYIAEIAPAKHSWSTRESHRARIDRSPFRVVSEPPEADPSSHTPTRRRHESDGEVTGAWSEPVAGQHQSRDARLGPPAALRRGVLDHRPDL